MSHDYKNVQWTPFKKRFDLWLLAGVAIYLIGFIVISYMSQPEGESLMPPQVLLRATGTLAFLLLTFILCIGPLARMTDRFKPFLYNRRHLGVTTFLIALIHAGLVVLWYHGFSETNPLVSLFISNPRYDSLNGFPFEVLGVAAFLIMFLMAATSHDFWNANLGPGVWKTLHMGVYLAYGLLVVHIALGAIQFNKSPEYVVLLAASASAEAPGTMAAPGTADVIAAALGELPEKVMTDVTDLMSSMNMTAGTTHFQRFVSREDGAVVNKSMALIK